MKKQTTRLDDTKEVNRFMEELDHPLKAGVQMIREVIKGVNKDITEQIKWKAPSFSYKGEYMVTFNPRDRQKIHLVFHNPKIALVKSKLLEGDYEDRRMAYFADENEIEAKKASLERALKDLIKLQNMETE
jgi:uncharacterized protein YdhG (YjbR/CyaY superfamily)